MLIPRQRNAGLATDLPTAFESASFRHIYNHPNLQNLLLTL